MHLAVRKLTNRFLLNALRLLPHHLGLLSLSIRELPPPHAYITYINHFHSRPVSPPVTLPAGYLGSSLIGAALIACGFDTKASKIACLVLAGFFILTLWWARRSLLCVERFSSAFEKISAQLANLALYYDCGFIMSEVELNYSTWLLILGMAGLIIAFWFIADSQALRFLVRHPILSSPFSDIPSCSIPKPQVPGGRRTALSAIR